MHTPHATHRNALQRTATHRNTPQHTATHRNAPQHTATHPLAAIEQELAELTELEVTFFFLKRQFVTKLT